MIKTFTMTALAGSLMLVSACSQGANSITASSVSSRAYEEKACTNLHNSLSKVQSEITELSRKQNTAATADAVGVFLLLVPVGNLAGLGVEEELAHKKGVRNAIEAEIEHRCEG